RELERGDDVARGAHAVVVEHAQADEVRGRRDAPEPAAGERAVAGDQPRDVRAMPETIDGYGRHARLAVGEVVEVGDAIGDVGNRRDAGIDHGDADAVAAGVGVRQAEQLAQTRTARARP